MTRHNAARARVLSAVALSLIVAACGEGPLQNTGEAPGLQLIWAARGIASAGPPAINGTSVYVRDVSGMVHALDRSSGRQLWTRVVSGGTDTYDLDVIGDRLVLSIGRLVALDVRDGTMSWERSEPEGYGTLSSTVSDEVILPTAYRGLGTAAVFDARSGDLLWRASVIPAESSATTGDQVRAFAPSVAGGRAVYPFAWWRGRLPARGGVATLDARSGTVQWSMMLPVDLQGVPTIPPFATTGNAIVLVSSYDGSVYGLAMDSGLVLWKAPRLLVDTPDIRPVAIVNGRALVGSGIGTIIALDPMSGAVQWQKGMYNGGVRSMHNISDRFLLATHYNGGLSLLNAATGDVHWRLTPRADNQRILNVCVRGDTLVTTGLSAGVALYLLR